MNHDQTSAAKMPDSVPGHESGVSARNALRPVRPSRQAFQAARRRNIFMPACLVLFAVLAAIRVWNIWNNTPEYDEIWTVQHYRNIPLPTIFSDVSVPNNHVLNTLGIRFFLSLIPYHNLAMRLTALLGFCGLFVILLRAVLLLLKNNVVRGGVLAVVLLNGMLLHYAETARGYSLQSFFVFGLFFSLLCFRLRPPENRMFNAVMWLLCAVGACLSVSSGVIYVVILTGLWGLLYMPFRAGAKTIWRESRFLVFAGAFWTVFVLAWYGGNYSRFAAGREMFGETFHTPARFCLYCFEAARDTGMIWALPCLAVFCILLRGKSAWRLCVLTGGAAVLMFGSALVTKGGPARIYLPLLAPAVFGIAAALDELLEDNKKLGRAAPWFLLFLVGVCLFFSDRDRKKAADPDMAVLFGAVANLDPGIFVSYKSSDLYVVRMLFRDAVEADNLERQSDPGMLLLLHENAISAVHAGDLPVEELVPPGAVPVAVDRVVPGEDVLFWLYRLRPVRSGESLDGKAVLCFASAPVPDGTVNWLTARFGVVNSMLFERDASRICFAAAGAGLDADALLKLEQDNQETLFFRVVSD